MKEITTNSNTVKGAIDQLYDSVMKKQKPVYMEINDLVIIVTPKNNVYWKRDIEKILDDENKEIINIIEK